MRHIKKGIMISVNVFANLFLGLAIIACWLMNEVTPAMAVIISILIFTSLSFVVNDILKAVKEEEEKKAKIATRRRVSIKG